MAKWYDHLDDRLRAFIDRQPMFFVATAPREGGHVNLSPKGYADTFAILSGNRVAYLDLYGSGAETIAHLRENGRITIMFCSFDREPKIMRLYGTGSVVIPETTEWKELIDHFGADHAGTRAIIVMDIEQVQTSCGFAVPFMELAGERTMLDDRAARRTTEEWVERIPRNAVSIDGLPALEPGHPAPSRRS